ncbi:hypothetical protein MUP79_08180 [Candidatus Bathyarchaeota archaeon]|nr:hypothetical protein [Candidatus Bathyarchaeota archaeon]
MKIIACYSVWNEERLIAESLRSVKAYVDGYVIVDSVYSSNPIQATHSTDKTREVCERTCAPLSLTYLESADKTSIKIARERYLKAVPEGDMVFVIDGDEVLYGNHSDILSLFESMRTGKIQKALSIPVYTTAVLAHAMAKDVTPEVYATNPLISTVGYMTRFFQNEAGIYHKALGIYDKNHFMMIDGKRNRTDKMFIVNHHTRQSHSEYVNDCIWEVAEYERISREAKT